MIRNWSALTDRSRNLTKWPFLYNVTKGWEGGGSSFALDLLIYKNLPETALQGEVRDNFFPNFALRNISRAPKHKMTVDDRQDVLRNEKLGARVFRLSKREGIGNVLKQGAWHLVWFICFPRHRITIKTLWNFYSFPVCVLLEGKDTYKPFFSKKKN